MSNQHLPQASIRIDMNQTMGFQHTFTGHPGMLIPLLGALKFTEDWIINEIKKNSETAKNPNPLCSDNKPISLEIEVPKDHALAFYWEAMKKLKERMIAINKSDPKATFTINPSSLKTL